MSPTKIFTLIECYCLLGGTTICAIFQKNYVICVCVKIFFYILFLGNCIRSWATMRCGMTRCLSSSMTPLWISSRGRSHWGLEEMQFKITRYQFEMLKGFPNYCFPIRFFPDKFNYRLLFCLSHGYSMDNRCWVRLTCQTIQYSGG